MFVGDGEGIHVADINDIRPVRPTREMDMWRAATYIFRTEQGWRYPLRIWLWVALPMALVYAVAYPMFLVAMADLATLEVGDEFPYLGRWLGSMLLFSIASMIPALLGAAAVHRKLVLGDDSRVPLRFSRDEANLLLTYLGVMGLFLAAYAALIIAMVLMVLLIGALSAVGGGALAVLGGILAGVVFIAGLIGLFYLMIRLIPAGAATIAYGRPVVIKALNISKHRALPIFGAYLIAYIMAYAVLIVVSLLALASMGIGGGILIGNVDALQSLADIPRWRLTLAAIPMGLGTAVAIVWLASVGSATVVAYGRDLMSANDATDPPGFA